MAKVAKCAKFVKHKWAWVRNFYDYRIGPRTGSAKLRGLYRCECGEGRIGQYNINAEPTK